MLAPIKYEVLLVEVKTLIVSDLHGQADKFERAAETLGSDSHWIINGDILDRGPDVKRLLDIILNLDQKTLLLGNHEWAYLAAMTAQDPNVRKIWREQALFNPVRTQRMEINTLSSYGISRYYDPEGLAKAMKDTLGELGHLAMLEDSEIFYEDDQVFVIHAGLRSELSMGKNYQNIDMARAHHEAHTYNLEPDEIFNGRLSKDMNTPVDLDKTLVTGHIHFRKNSIERVTKAAQDRLPSRVMLASCMDLGDPLFVYDASEHRVLEFN